jgi:hypothetical protein
LQNHRAAEAITLLASLNPETLSVSQQAIFHLVFFEAALESGDIQEAAASARKIDRNALFPNQLKWLDEKTSRLASSPAVKRL